MHHLDCRCKQHSLGGASSGNAPATHIMAANGEEGDEGEGGGRRGTHSSREMGTRCPSGGFPDGHEPVGRGDDMLEPFPTVDDFGWRGAQPF